MTDQELNKYCAEVMGYEYHSAPFSDSINIGYTKNGVWHVQDLYKPHSDLNQMAKVFDKLVSKTVVNCHIPDAPENLLFSQLSISMVTEGIAQAMREFIESTGEI